MNAITHKAWRNGALWIGAAMIGLVVLIAGINSTRAPLQLARTLSESSRSRPAGTSSCGGLALPA